MDDKNNATKHTTNIGNKRVLRVIYRVFLSAVFIIIGLAFTACSSMMSSVTSPLMRNLTKAVNKQSDPELVRNGAAAYLLLIDGLIENDPKNEQLLLAGANLYGAYNSAFISDQDRERSKLLTEKAKDYSFRALSSRNRSFSRACNLPFEQFQECLQTFTKDDVPYLFIAISSWAAWVQARTDNWDAIADVAKIRALNEKLLQLNDAYYYGSPHLIMGVLYTILPPDLGGKPEEAKKHFEKAIEIGKGKFFPAYILYAKQYARTVFDKTLYNKLLEYVIETPADIDPEIILINTLAKQNAKKLLEDGNQYFD